MKKICLCFQIHQPYRLRRYRFFDIGHEHDYLDGAQNDEVFDRIAQECYIPASRMILELLRQYPDFRVSYVISGLALDQMQARSSELVDLLREINRTGRVEFLTEPYAHSLSSIYDPDEWRGQLDNQSVRLEEVIGATASKVLCNTELIYNNGIGQHAAELGFRGVLTEGAKHILGWKSPNYLYQSDTEQPLTLLLRNSALSEFISKDFTRYDSPEYPITADKLLSRVKWLPQEEEFVCLYVNYEVLGAMHPRESGIFDFFRAIPMLAESYGVTFATPTELLDTHSPVGTLSVNNPISSSGEERSINDWTGNVLQQGVLQRLTKWGPRARLTRDLQIYIDWMRLQSIDHLYYMNMNGSGQGFSPYSSAYEAFNNYMNVWSDFERRIDTILPPRYETEQLNLYDATIIEQEREIASLKAEIERLKQAVASTPPPKPSRSTKAKRTTSKQAKTPTE